jgi:hypothetical protein
LHRVTRPCPCTRHVEADVLAVDQDEAAAKDLDRALGAFARVTARDVALPLDAEVVEDTEPGYWIFAYAPVLADNIAVVVDRRCLRV